MSAEDAATTTESTAEVSSSPEPQSGSETSSQPSSQPSVTPTTTETSKSAKETVLDAVLKVIPADTTQDALDTPEAKALTQPEEGTTETESEADDETEPGPDASTPMIRKKIQKLLKKYHTQKAELYQASQELEAIRPKAEIGVQMETFAKDNGLSGSDVANIMQIGAYARRGDYKSFYEAIKPLVRTAQEYLGIALPKQARDMVQAGQMSEGAARELVRAQMDRQLTETTLQQQQRDAAQQNLQNTQDYVQRTVTALEEQFAARDPDYKAKAASVLRTAQAMLHERGGTITNVQEALNITKAAYDEVNATFRRLQPQPHATARKPNGNGQTRSARPEASSPYEAALQGLERARNGTGY